MQGTEAESTPQDSNVGLNIQSNVDPSSVVTGVGAPQMPAMPDLMSMGRGGFGMSSETWGQVAARAAMLAAQLREMEMANSQQNASINRQQADEGSSRPQDSGQGNGGVWITPNGMPPFVPGQDQLGGIPMNMFVQPGMMAQDYRVRMPQQMGGIPGAVTMTQEELMRSLQGLPQGALIAAGIPMPMDGFRRGKPGMAAETRRQNDKEKKRRKRERIGELIKAVRL